MPKLRLTHIISTLSYLLIASCTAEDLHRDFTIFNESGCRIEVHWINPDTQQRVLQTSPYIYAGATFNLNSYVSHRFEVKELPSTKTGNCKNGAEGPSNPKLCGLAYFTVNENYDQVFYIREGLHVQHDDNHSLALSKAAGLLDVCQRDALEAGGDDDGEGGVREMVGDLARCIEENLKTELGRQEEEERFQSGVRGEMAGLLASYACVDTSNESSEGERTESWSPGGGEGLQDWHRERGRRRGRRSSQVRVLHDRPASKVHVITNFVSEAECDAMEKGLQGFGGGMRSSSDSLPAPNEEGVRVLEQTIEIPWDQESSLHPTAAVSRRILDYTNHVLGLDIDEHGQESLTSYQYSAVSRSKHTPSVTLPQHHTERYVPADLKTHCESERCRGKPHRVGQRMAAMVLYCEVPGKKGGGAVNFRNFGAHYVPEKGSAMFFSYMDPQTWRMDEGGYTEHMDCPVVAGEKRIVKQWIRHGVHRDNPWDLFEHETAEITAEKMRAEMEDDEEL